VPTYRYFAYGSNMSTERLRGRTPSARPLGRASLAGHILRWHKLGRDGTGKCDAAYTGKRSDTVWGVLFEIDRAEKAALDRVEGLGIGYDEAEVQVVLAGACCSARTYRAKPGRTDAALKPRQWYKDHVLRGAREHELPVWYIEHLEGLAAIP
jgi:gamma-glutamylcyclotransferase (GGCT)/AIG2-like uncharacterized protein YtfP